MPLALSVVVGCRQSFHGITISEIAEGLALHCVVSLALDEGLHKVIMQSDCLSLIKKVNATEDHSITRPFVANIKC